ncbi:MAG TPA: diguanylate cyclase [Candidatus Limnocylindrales bacterium]
MLAAVTPDADRLPAVLDLRSAARVAGVTPRTIERWCTSGDLPSLRVHGRRRIDADALQAYLARRRGEASRAPARRDPRLTIAAVAQAELDGLVRQLLDQSAHLFGADAAGLWLAEPDGRLTAAASRDLGPALRAAAEALPTGRGVGPATVHSLTPRVLTDPARQATTPVLRRAYRDEGIRTSCFVPVTFQNEALGLLVLFHRERHRWSEVDLVLASAFADRLGTAIQNARLHDSIRALAARLQAVQDLTQRLNRIQDVRGIGAAIVAEAGALIDYDTVRVYLVDEAAGVCEPVAFKGRFMGVEDPSPEMLRVPVGVGLTGWVAANGRPIRVGDASRDARSKTVGPERGPESLLVVPMAYEDRVRGVIVLSKLGVDRFSADDETTLSIFAGHAAQAIVNAETFEQVRRQQAELEHQLAGQRKLLEVNERLLSTLEPEGVLELIADSLRSVVAYDSLTIYRVDREAGVRRAVVARDRYAAEILADAAPLDRGITGWVIRHGDATLANDAHADPRAFTVPGTPVTPESMIVVPLVLEGEVGGTLNVSRDGGREAHFNQNEFELTKLFGALASVALRTAETHHAAEARAELDPLTGVRNHGAFQRELETLLADPSAGPFGLVMLDLDDFKAFNDTRGHPAGDALLRDAASAMRHSVRDADHVYRYGGDEFAALLPAATLEQAEEVAERIRVAIGRLAGAHDAAYLGASAGVAAFPQDGPTKEALVKTADERLYRAKPERGRHQPPEPVPHDAYLAALHETALELMQRQPLPELLRRILARAAALMGTAHGYIYLVDPVPAETATCVLGSGALADLPGVRVRPGEGVGGRVWASGEGFAVADYDAFAGRLPGLAAGLGSVVGVPLRSGGRVVGALGLASGSSRRVYGRPEIDVLTRFAQLASIALDNAELHAAAGRELAERSRAEAALRASELRFRRLADASFEALALHRDGRIIEVNAAFAALFGCTAEEAVGRPLEDFAAPASRRLFRQQADASLEGACEALAMTSTGEVFPVELVGRTLPAAGDAPDRVTAVRDARERRAFEERLVRQAFLDALTGLPNRELLMDRLAHALARAGRSARSVAVLLLDLDRFKVINESLGHRVGDQLLVAVAKRLSAGLRPGDTVARLGGDEFVVLLESVAGQDEAVRVAERVLTELTSPFRVKNRDAFVGASIGIAVARPGRAAADDVLRGAAIALHRAKADAGAAVCVVYDPTMSAPSVERLDLESDLRRALEREELVLHYQPIVDLATARPVGLEALVRWQHPRRGLVGPLSFVPLAEETGLILPLGSWVLRAAAEQARRWQTAFPGLPLTMSVNLSARQFAQPGLVAQVAAALEETGLAPGSLELEITETVLMGESESVLGALRRLRALGVRLALDDFGTGYSSLSYLRQLPLDEIKIDRSFVADLETDEANRSIVQAVVSLAHGLGIGVTAEGIETTGQLARLRAFGCDRGQGFYYARPLPAAEVTRTLRTALPAAGRGARTAAAG